jgi:3-phosphoshikimate 1-carboxyvinyltransferase
MSTICWVVAGGQHVPGSPAEARTIQPLAVPPDVTVRVPGSKSLTNRALVAAALARGTSRLHGVLFADDTEAMLGCLAALGIELRIDRDAEVVEVVGCGGVIPVSEADLDVRLSGTTARFVAPLLAAARGRFRLDGGAPFRLRPMGPVLDALEALGADVEPLGEPGHLPVQVTAHGARGGRVEVAGDRSSQFLSGLLLVAPVLPDGLQVRLRGPLVSEPYVQLTVDVLEAFGARVQPVTGGFDVAGDGYRASAYAIEPDASAASYPLAAAAITGGRVRVAGLHAGARQGDAGFARVLEHMGAEVTIDADGTEVRGTGTLQGIDVDLGPMSDTAQTLAAVATFATGPTRVRGIGFIRAKETDRIAAVVTELRRCGITATEDDDGFTVHPGVPAPTAFETYDDHRMAMSFALLGLVHDGITILDPGCVAKTFPGYYDLLEQLRVPGDHTGPPSDTGTGVHTDAQSGDQPGRGR